MSDHKCLWHDCLELIPNEKLFCRHHWYKLTDEMRAKIWKEYKAYGRISMDTDRELKKFIEDYDKEPAK